MRKIIILPIWFFATISTLVISLFLQKYRGNFLAYQQAQEALLAIEASQKAASYQLYASTPNKVLGTNTSIDIKAENPTPEIIKTYLEAHNSPMLEAVDSLLETAEKYNIDPLFLIAIAQCESNLGKKMPSPDCYNPFGWGIHSEGTLCFESWEEGFEKVVKGLSEKYFGKGYETPEEIMAKYTPQALEKNGSWAKCVNQFLAELRALQ